LLSIAADTHKLLPGATGLIEVAHDATESVLEEKLVAAVAIAPDYVI
jgi:hypothetical protein